jgi:hypothetical protein
VLSIVHDLVALHNVFMSLATLTITIPREIIIIKNAL